MSSKLGFIPEQPDLTVTPPQNPGVGYFKKYKRDGVWYWLDDSGTERALESDQHKKTITGHGFSTFSSGVLPVRFDGTSWVQAQSDSETNVSTALIVKIEDADTVLFQDGGFIEQAAHGMDVGFWYVLSDATAGSLVREDLYTGSFKQKVLFTLDANTLLLQNVTASGFDKTLNLNQPSHGISMLGGGSNVPAPGFVNALGEVEIADASDVQKECFGLITVVDADNVKYSGTDQIIDCPSHGFTVGDILYLQNGGGVANTAPANQQKIFEVLSADQLQFIKQPLTVKGAETLYKGELATIADLTGIAFPSLVDAYQYYVDGKSYIWDADAASGAFEPDDKPNTGIDPGYWIEFDSTDVLTSFGSPTVDNTDPNNPIVTLPYVQENGSTQNVVFTLNLPTPASVINSIDLKSGANPNELTIDITYTDDLGNTVTVSDTTPFDLSGLQGPLQNPDGTPADSSSTQLRAPSYGSKLFESSTYVSKLGVESDGTIVEVQCPGDPTTFSAESLSPTSINLIYSESTDTDTYVAMIAPSGSDAFVRYEIENISGVDHIVNDLTPKTLYVIRLYASSRGCLSENYLESTAQTSPTLTGIFSPSYPYTYVIPATGNYGIGVYTDNTAVEYNGGVIGTFSGGTQTTQSASEGDIIRSTKPISVGGMESSNNGDFEGWTQGYFSKRFVGYNHRSAGDPIRIFAAEDAIVNFEDQLGNIDSISLFEGQFGQIISPAVATWRLTSTGMIAVAFGTTQDTTIVTPASKEVIGWASGSGYISMDTVGTTVNYESGSVSSVSGGPLTTSVIASTGSLYSGPVTYATSNNLFALSTIGDADGSNGTYAVPVGILGTRCVLPMDGQGLSFGSKEANVIEKLDATGAVVSTFTLVGGGNSFSFKETGSQVAGSRYRSASGVPFTAVLQVVSGSGITSDPGNEHIIATF